MLLQHFDYQFITKTYARQVPETGKQNNFRQAEQSRESTKKVTKNFLLMTYCRGDRTRTCDSLVPNQERYQLRYTPEN